MLRREQMTQKLWDERQQKALIVERGCHFSAPSFLPWEVWIWRPENPNTLEYRWADSQGSGFMAYVRPMSYIESEGRIIRVLFRTDRSSTEFLKILMHSMREAEGYTLDAFGFCGIEEQPK